MIITYHRQFALFLVDCILIVGAPHLVSSPAISSVLFLSSWLRTSALCCRGCLCHAYFDAPGALLKHAKFGSHGFFSFVLEPQILDPYQNISDISWYIKAVRDLMNLICMLFDS